MSYCIHVNAIAVVDIEEIRASLAEISPQASNRMVRLIESAIEALADFPKRHPVAPESQSHPEEIRHVLVGNYRVLFMIIGETVNILRVWHTARRPFRAGELN